MQKHPYDDPVENLSHAPAIEKIRELSKSARVCLFVTLPGQFPLSTRPMAVQDVDAAGNLWFLSARSSVKNKHINRDPRVQLFFGNPGDSQYLTVHGFATVSDNRALREKYWTPIAKTWIHEGVDDPELTVIRVTVKDGYYWDTEHGKAIALVKIAVGAMTGKTMDDSVEGKVRP
ncbi:MAG TPA: pyridoxamine 5'-phosphate oxidase family protein [Opitutaceae bacterium]|nr:pyridoxamine 5'-phosphate oxidase family protein [Opitutaceae bacterium]